MGWAACVDENRLMDNSGRPINKMSAPDIQCNNDRIATSNREQKRNHTRDMALHRKLRPPTAYIYMCGATVTSIGRVSVGEGSPPTPKK